jgi:hypothetical protein
MLKHFSQFEMETSSKAKRLLKAQSVLWALYVEEKYMKTIAKHFERKKKKMHCCNCNIKHHILISRRLW